MKTLSLIVTLIIACSGFATSQETDSSHSRHFEFNYGFKVSGLPDGANVNIWVPVAQSNDHQEIQMGAVTSPTNLQFHQEQNYGNRIGYCSFESDGQPIPMKINYRVNRREATAGKSFGQLPDKEKQLFLKANQLVPVLGKPQVLLDGKKLPVEAGPLGQSLYELVLEHMNYDKTDPGYGKGDAVWACDSRTGNCTDFHSLFISLARSRRVPAKFEIGFPIGTAQQGVVSGYHCWAWFYDDIKGWRPVDISEADKHPELTDYYFGNLTPDRIAFSTGRDIELQPESTADSLNFFIYPHVEVDGKIWPKEKIKYDFSYQELSDAN